MYLVIPMKFTRFYFNYTLVNRLTVVQLMFGNKIFVLKKRLKGEINFKLSHLNDHLQGYKFPWKTRTH